MTRPARGPYWNRRTFLTALTGSLLTAPLAAEAQPAEKLRRIGLLSHTRQPWNEGFRQGLRDLGYIDRHSITNEYRSADGNFEQLPRH